MLINNRRSTSGRLGTGPCATSQTNEGFKTVGVRRLDAALYTCEELGVKPSGYVGVEP